MDEKAEYLDIRSDFWSGCWAEAESYGACLEGSDPKRARKWESLGARIPSLGAEQRARLTGYARTVNVLVVSGVWCGDCVRQGPMIRQIVEACDREVSLGVIDRDFPPEELSAERDEWVTIFERMLLMVRLAPPLRKRHGD